MQNKTSAYKGIMELLKQLSKDGYKISIVSNKFDKAVKGLNRLYFEDYIKVSIGDSEVDVKTAKNSGVLSVGVTWGFRDREVLESKGADYIIDYPQELISIIAS